MNKFLSLILLFFVISCFNSVTAEDLSKPSKFNAAIDNISCTVEDVAEDTVDSIKSGSKKAGMYVKEKSIDVGEKTKEQAKISAKKVKKATIKGANKVSNVTAKGVKKAAEKVQCSAEKTIEKTDKNLSQEEFEQK